MERRPYLTFILIGANVAVFGVMVALGVSPTDPTQEQLLRFGANHGVSVVFEREWWRAATSIFVHIGALHLLVNMYSLWRLGAVVERLLHGPLYLLVYVLAGLGGSFVSVIWNPLGISAGASGAIFGLFGFVTGFALQARHLLPPNALRGLWDGILATVAINVFLALSIPYLDNAAHLGGAGIGLLAGFVATASAIERDGKGASFGSQLIVIAAVIGLAVLAKVRTENNPKVQVALLLVDADKARASGELEKAEAFTTKAIAISSDPTPLVARAMVRRERGDLDGGIADLDRFVDRLKGPDRELAELKAFELRAELQFATGNYAAADADLTRALNGSQQPDWFGRRAFARFRLGDFDGGLADAKTARADSRTDAVTLNNAAWALLMSQGDLPVALELVDEALKRDPASAAARGTRCWILVERGEPEGGLPDCVQAVASANELMDRGMVAFIQHRPEEAIELWEQAGAKNPLDAKDLVPWLARARAQIEATP